MPRYTEDFEVVRLDAYHEGLDLLREVERKASLDTVEFLPGDKNRALARGGVAQRLFEAGFTNDDIKGLIGPWAHSWMGANVREAVRLLETQPQIAVTRTKYPDKQKSKVYQAEARIPGGEALTQSQVERYVAQIMADPWFKLHHPEVEIGDIKFQFPKKGSIAKCTTNGKVHTLRFPESMRNRLVVVHELSHAATNAKWDRARIAGHGVEFAYTYLRLVYRRFGRVIGFALQNAFIDLKVQMSPRIKPLALSRDVPSEEPTTTADEGDEA
jgi:hypothetical protein